MLHHIFISVLAVALFHINIADKICQCDGDSYFGVYRDKQLDTNNSILLHTLLHPYLCSEDIGFEAEYDSSRELFHNHRENIPLEIEDFPKRVNVHKFDIQKYTFDVPKGEHDTFIFQLHGKVKISESCKSYLITAVSQVFDRKFLFIVNTINGMVVSTAQVSFWYYQESMEFMTFVHRFSTYRSGIFTVFQCVESESWVLASGKEETVPLFIRIRMFMRKAMGKDRNRYEIVARFVLDNNGQFHNAA